MAMMTVIARRPVFVAVLGCAILSAFWIVFAGSKNPPIDPGVSHVAVSRTGRWLAAGTSQGRITVWEQAHPDAPQRLAVRGRLNDLQFSPDECALAIASRNLGIYAVAESAAPRLLRSDRRNYGSARFSRDGRTLVVVTGAGVIETIDARSGTSRLEVCCSSIYGEAVFTPDAQAIATAGHWPRLWDARSGELLGRLTAGREFYTFGPIAFDAGRGAILLGSQDGRVYAWDWRTARRIGVSPAQPAYVDSLAVSTTGWVAFAGFGKDVQLWNPDTGERRSLPGARPTSNLALGPDDGALVFGTADGSIEFWDVRSEQRLRATRIPGAAAATSSSPAP